MQGLRQRLERERHDHGPQTIAGQSATCQVKLNAAPPEGTHTVVATIEKVPGEKNTANNTLSFPVTFQ